jgi:hypothetical protein
MASFMKSARALVPLAATGTLLLAAPASAGTAQHSKQSLGPFVADAPAGALCDFAYHEQTSFTQNTTRFFDDAGHLVRVEDQVDLRILHRNADTGQTLTERDHYAAHVDLVTGEATVTGQTWHLRNEDGRLVVSGAGLYVQELVTGDVVRETANAKADVAGTLCQALAGAAAA